MFRRIEERNRELWSDHPTIVEDLTHVVGGIGLGLLLAPILGKRQAKPVAWAMVLASAAMHFYADTFKPRAARRMRRQVKRRGLAELLRSRLSAS